MNRLEKILIDAAWDQRLAEETVQPIQWWYLSFADEHKFRGGLFIQGHGRISAIQRSIVLDLNPGGYVHGYPIDEDDLPAMSYRERLLSKDEVEALNAAA